MPDRITLTIPGERDFHDVAHLVLGGLASRLNLTLESLEDLQIAIDAVLGEAHADGEITVSMCLDGDELETTIEPVDVRGELERDGDEIGLRRVLDTVVDSVEVDEEHVRLTKRVARGG
jgi:hypothetical protein